MQKTKIFFPFIIFCIYCSESFSQDSLQKKWTTHFSEELWMQKNFQFYSGVSMPRFIKNERRLTTTLPTRFDSVTDNPLTHGATYVAVKSSICYNNKVNLYFDLYAEQRGASYGLFNKDNLLLYPVLRVEANDSIKLLKQPFLLRAKAGMFLNEKLDEGLTIYNVDAQGLQLSLEHKNWILKGTVYADFYGGIGLNIDDIYALSVSRKLNSDSVVAGISVNYDKQEIFYTPINGNYIFNAFAHKNLNHKKLYTQFAFRTGNDFVYQSSNLFIEKIAGLLGIEYTYNYKNFCYSNTTELRYYGTIFNEGFYAAGLRYRNPATNLYEMYANTVGEYIYPLRKFNTPFSQWAVYTEYIFSNVFAINLRGNLTDNFNDKLSAGLSYDINYIFAKSNVNLYRRPPASSFLYPFFTADFSYNMIKNFKASILLTNQAMNLDVSYPTFYLLSHPRLGFRLTASF